MSLSEVYLGLLEALKMPFSYLLNSESRIHFLYLFSSLLLAYYVYRKTKVEGSFWAYVFRKDVWTSRSSIIDYSLIFFNAIVKVFLVGPYLVFGFYLSFKIEAILPAIIGYPKESFSATTTIVLYTIFLTVAKDFGTYVTHYFMHRVPMLWEFHKTHHSATVLNPITQYRIHPVELVINNATGILVLGVVTGVFRYLSAHSIDEFTFIGANVFSFVFLVFGSNLRHSHIPLKYFNRLEYIFISPYQHQIHHSNRPEHFNRNMGSKLAIWDWLFGTLIRSEGVQNIEFGIGAEDDVNYDSVWKNLIRPFSNLWRFVRSK